MKEIRRLSRLVAQRCNTGVSHLRCFASMVHSSSHSSESSNATTSRRHKNAMQQASSSPVRVGSTPRKRCRSSSLSKRAATQQADFPPNDRWKAVPPANLVHLSIGGVYVYSMWTPAMTQAMGVVSSAPLDWTHSQVLPVFSCAAISLGVTTHFFGSWVEQVGPRKAGTVGSLFWSMGLITTGTGVYLHQLPLVYAGYSILGGIGWGLMYLR